MKRSTILCASVVALAVIAMSADGASAATYSTTKSNTRGHGMTTAPKPYSGGPKHQGDSRVNSELENVNGGALGGPKKTTSSSGPKTENQSTTVNHARVNIKNNMGVMGGGGGGTNSGGAAPGGGGRRQ
jgi:hypothetical protein